MLRFVNFEDIKSRLDRVADDSDWKMQAITGKISLLPTQVVRILVSAATTGRLRKDLLRALLLRPGLFPASWAQLEKEYEIPTERCVINELAAHISKLLPAGMDGFCDHLTKGYGLNDVFAALLLYPEQDINEPSHVYKFEAYLRDYVSGAIFHDRRRSGRAN